MHSHETPGRDPLRSWARIVDCGDAPMTWLDNRVAIRSLDRAHEDVSSRRAKSEEKSVTPRIVMLGGDHTTTLSALRSVKKRWGSVSVVHFDSHIGEKRSKGLQSFRQRLTGIV